MEKEQIIIQKQTEVLPLRTDITEIKVSTESLDGDLPDTLWIDFDYGEDKEKGIKSAGPETYVISPITEQNLFSDKYLNCTGTVGIGRDKISGKEIAFISHQDPDFFINKGQEETDIFANDLRTTLDELVSRSEIGTVDVVIFGGNDNPDDLSSKKTTDYLKSIEVLNKIISAVFGHNPTVLSGPNRDGGAIDITVLTKERKVFIGR